MKFASEAALVEVIANYMRSDGWEIFFEIAPWGSGSSRADIVVRRGQIVGVIECKLSMSLSLLEQSRFWIGKANFVWAAVPARKGTGFAARLLQEWGCGLLTARANGVTEVPAKLHRKIHPKLLKSLVPESKDTIPGASHGYSTPFSRTVDELRRVMADGKPRPVKEVVDAMKHHYRSSQSARSTLVKRVQQKIIKGIGVAEVGGKLCFVCLPRRSKVPDISLL